MRYLTWLWMMPVAVVVALMVSCGSGSSTNDDDDDDGGQENIATLSGTIDYTGDNLSSDGVQGLKVVFGLIQEWPMTGAPKEFLSVDVPDSGFPFAYEIDLSYTGSFFLAAFLDVNPMDGVQMNAELDPMDVPDEGEDKAEIAEGANQRDFVLIDPEDVDYWWVE
jgi:hypothetical protein